MSNLKKVNVLRRILMRSLTKNIGNSNWVKSGPIDKRKIKRVLICRPNGRLGNLLLITPLIEEVSKVFPDCKIDLFVKGTLASIIFKNHEHIDKIIELPKQPFKDFIKYLKMWNLIREEKYDLVINVDQISSSGRLAVKVCSAPYKIFGDLPENVTMPYEDYGHIAKYPVYNFRFALRQLGLMHREAPVALLDLKLTENEIKQGKKTLDNISGQDKKTIVIFTYATGEKRYRAAWWEDFYAVLKKEYLDCNIVEVLPFENVSQINFQAVSFYSRDVREIGSVLANADVFVGADSGIMHLAAAVKVPTVGLFSVSDLKKYEPYGNNSIGIDTTINEMPDFIRTINSILYK